MTVKQQKYVKIIEMIPYDAVESYVFSNVKIEILISILSTEGGE